MKTSRGAGKVPAGASWIHCGVPPEPFAFVRTHVSFLSLTPLSPPPNIVIRLVFGSYTARCPARPGGAAPVGASWVQVGVPPTPLAFDSTPTWLNNEQNKT